MKTINYTCDRCNKPTDESKVVSVDVITKKGMHSTEHITAELCDDCYNTVFKATMSALTGKQCSCSTKEQTPATVAKENKPTEDKKVQSTYISGRKEGKLNSGKPEKKIGARHKKLLEQAQEIAKEHRKLTPTTPTMSKLERELILIYHKEGLDNAGIAELLGRTEQGVSRSLNTMLGTGKPRKVKTVNPNTQEAQLSKIVDEMAEDNLEDDEDDEDGFHEEQCEDGTTIWMPSSTPSKPKEDIAPTERPVKEAKSNKGRKAQYDNGEPYSKNTPFDKKIKVDRGGIMALYRAGWDAQAIAYDTKLDTKVVKQVIAEETAKKG